MNFKLYYTLQMRVDLSHKTQSSFDLNSLILDSTLSAIVAKKQRYVDSAVVKLNLLFTKLSNNKPLIKTTNSLVVFKSTIKKDDMWFFMLNYLKESGRYTISPLSLHKNQVNFMFTDYNFLANFINIKYDFFNWRYNIRVGLNFGTKNELSLKMILLSLITLKVF